jgi:sigma-B regulation protein RsbU (phosphoserine phosphatase)
VLGRPKLQAMASPSPALIEQLLHLPGDERGAREFVVQVFAAWCQGAGLREAALYLPSDRGLRRHLQVGERSFPATLPRTLPSGMASLPLAGATLVFPADCHPQPPEPDPLAPLLHAVLHVARLEAQLKQQHFQVNYRVVELEALYDVGLAIAGTLDLEHLSEEILLRAVSLLDARRGALYLYEDGRYQLARTIGSEATAELDLGAPALAAALAGETAGAAVIMPGVTHHLAVAIEVDGRPGGVLLVGDRESRDGVGPFTANDRRTLSLFANQAAIALENAHLHRQALEKERLEREMVLAGEIQRRILPKANPSLAQYEVAGWNRPARQIGGDYYDFLALPDGRLGLVVGDVSGKGMPAALMVSTLHSALRLLVPGVELGSDLFARLNQHILDSSTPNKFITLLLAELDPASGHLTYVNAGHNPGLLLRGSEVLELPPSGVPLGLVPGARYAARTADLAVGDVLCLYSDGITEATSPGDEEFGAERLAELLRAHRNNHPPAAIAAVAAAVDAFTAGMPQGDDQTLVVVRRNA